MEEPVTVREDIKPKIDLNGAIILAEKLYGIKIESAKELDGYDDKNYHFKVVETPQNKFLSHSPNGFVFKITNSLDSKNLDCMEAQCEMMMHLDKHGVRTPQPQRQLDGRLCSLEYLQDNESDHTVKPAGDNRRSKNAVRLLSFQEGTLLKHVPWTYELHYKVGRYTAQLDLALQDFYHLAYEHYTSLWFIENAPQIKDFLCVVKDEEKVILVESVIKAFEEKVLSRLASLKSGMIHGDVNDGNLLVDLKDEGRWEVSAVLDMGDAHLSAYVLELALAMTYMMLDSGCPESGRHVAAGYLQILPLPPAELALLQVCVCARLCQSLVLGLHSYSLQPNNPYLLTTQSQGGWKLLNTLWTSDSQQLQDSWLQDLPYRRSGSYI